MSTDAESIVVEIYEGAPGLGVPPGGTDGQVVTKDGATPYKTKWADPTGGGGGGAVTSVAGKTGVVVLNKADVGLGNVDNTTDLNKPVSTAQAAAIALKQDVIAPGTTAQYRRGDNTWQTLDKAAVGLGSVDNTADSAKPVSTAQAAANAAVQAFAVQRSNHTGTQLASTISDFNTAADARITAQKGAASGLAPLDSGSKISTAYLPASVLGALSYQGTWNASTNSPALASGVGNKGFMYKVSVAGNTTLDGYSNWSVGDFAIFNGTTWDGVDGSSSEVLSVFGRVGAVTAQSGDYTTAQVTESGNLYFTNARAIGATLTGYTAGAGTITAADSVLSAIQKLAGNLAGATGNVTGAGSTTVNAIGKWGNTGGTSLVDSGVLIDASNNITGVGTLSSGAQTIVSTSAAAMAVGPSGNPVFNVNASAASAVEGWSVVGNALAAGFGPRLQATSPNTNAAAQVAQKGTGQLYVGNGSGGVTLFGGTTVSAGGTVAAFSAFQSQFQNNQRGGALPGFAYAGVNGTFTASTEVPVVDFNTNQTCTYNSGAKAFQRDVRIGVVTNAATAATTISVAATLGLAGAPVAGTNITQTISCGLYLASNNVGSGTVDSFGIRAAAPTGASNGNWAAQFDGPTIQNGAALYKRTAVADAAYTMLTTDFEVAYTTLTATRALTLPTSLGTAANPQYFIVKDESGNAGSFAITIVGTVDGATNRSINTNFGVMRLKGIGATYYTW